MKLRSALSSIALACCCTSPAFATLITSAGDPSLQGSSSYGFDDLPSPAPGFGMLSIPGVATIQDSGGGNMYVLTGAGSGTNQWLYTGSGPKITINFNDEVSAFGFDWYLIDYFVEISAWDANGDLLESHTVSGVPVMEGYVGIAGNGIRTVTLTSYNNIGEIDTDNYLIDNLAWKFASRTETPHGTVPEPASLALVGLALAGLGWQQRRRSQRS